jgi:hypothetical protein
MIVSVVIGLVVLAGFASWLVDRRRRRRNAMLDQLGLVRADDAQGVGETSPSPASEASNAEAMFWVLGRTGGKN